MGTEQFVTIFNLADVATPVLKQYRLDGQQFEVCGQLVAPGETTTVAQSVWQAAQARYARLCKLGAICAGAAPATYLEARAAQRARAFSSEDT